MACGCCKLVNTLLDFSRIEAGRMQVAERSRPIIGAFTAELASLVSLGDRARRACSS